jgi:hypothetical protein
MKRCLKVVEVIREVSPEETRNEEIKSNAWEFRGIEMWEDIGGGVKPPMCVGHGGNASPWASRAYQHYNIY